jgi:hypothetical protein
VLPPDGAAHVSDGRIPRVSFQVLDAIYESESSPLLLIDHVHRNERIGHTGRHVPQSWEHLLNLLLHPVPRVIVQDLCRIGFTCPLFYRFGGLDLSPWRGMLASMNVIIIAFFVGLLMVAGVMSIWRQVTDFNARFPPIDDDEFIRRCGPGVNRDVAIRVRRIVSEQLGIEYERVYPEQKFVEDLGCD